MLSFTCQKTVPGLWRCFCLLGCLLVWAQDRTQYPPTYILPALCCVFFFLWNFQCHSGMLVHFSFEKRNPQLKTYPNQVSSYTTWWVMWKGPVHCGQCLPLWCIRKQVEQATRSKPLSSVTPFPASTFSLEFLLWHSFLMSWWTEICHSYVSWIFKFLLRDPPLFWWASLYM